VRDPRGIVRAEIAGEKARGGYKKSLCLNSRAVLIKITPACNPAMHRSDHPDAVADAWLRRMQIPNFRATGFRPRIRAPAPVPGDIENGPPAALLEANGGGDSICEAFSFAFGFRTKMVRHAPEISAGRWMFQFSTFRKNHRRPQKVENWIPPKKIRRRRSANPAPTLRTQLNSHRNRQTILPMILCSSPTAADCRGGGRLLSPPVIF